MNSTVFETVSWSVLPPKCLPESSEKVFTKTHCLFEPQQEPGQFSYCAPRTDFYKDNMISPGYFKDRFMDTLEPVAYVLEHHEIYSSMFLFYKLIIDVVVMVIRHLEITKKAGASSGFGKTLLSASYNIFLMSVLTSMYDPRAPTLAAADEERKTFRNEEELNDMTDDTKKRKEHFYPVMSPAQFSQAATPISRVYICFNCFSMPLYIQLCVLVTTVCQSSSTQKKISKPLRLLVPTVTLIIQSPFFLLSLLFQKYPLIQLHMTRRPSHLHNLPTIPQLQSQTLLLLPRLDYSSQFPFLKTISLKLLKNFFHLVHFYRTCDPFFHAPITSNFSLFTLFLDVNIAVSTTTITHGEQNDHASINFYNTVSNQNSPPGK